MINKIALQLFIFFVMNCVQLQGQIIEKAFNADSVFIYKDFKEWGTTARLWHNHRILDSTNAFKTKISNSDLVELNAIVSNTKQKKLFQQKYGGQTYYLIVYTNGYRKKFVAGMGSKFEMLDDLDEMKRWVIKDPIDIENFYKLMRKYCL